MNGKMDSARKERKVIIAGSRGITDYGVVCKAVTLSGFIPFSEIVSGTAHGVDQLGERLGREAKIKVVQFPANWQGEGRAAGIKRNERMCHYADALIAVWDGKSRGTKHCIDYAKRCGLEVFVYHVGQMPEVVGE